MNKTISLVSIAGVNVDVGEPDAPVFSGRSALTGAVIAVSRSRDVLADARVVCEKVPNASTGLAAAELDAVCTLIERMVLR